MDSALQLCVHDGICSMCECVVLAHCYCVCVLSGVKSTLVVRSVCVSSVCMYGLALQLCVLDGMCV